MSNEVKVNTININGVEYVQKGQENLSPISNVSMVRSDRAGVFFGELVKRNGGEVTLKNARRVYYWDGAATLSQLAQEGTCKPQNCKFPPAVTSVDLLGVIEIIPVTDKALKVLNSVKEWRA